MRDVQQQMLEDQAKREAAAQPPRMDLLDALIAIAARKALIVKVTAAAAILAAVLVFLWPKSYTGEARVLPPQQNQSPAAALLTQLSGSGLGGMMGEMAGKTNSELYMALLKSRSIHDSLIERFDLKRVYGSKTTIAAREKLVERTWVAAGKDGVIVIQVEDRDPTRAADLANAYVAELDALWRRISNTQAAQRRIYFEGQLQGAKEALSRAEVDLKVVQEKTGLLHPDGQSRVIIENLAAIRAQVAAREVQLSAMRSYATAEHPQYLRLVEELKGLRAQQAMAERSNMSGNGDVMVATAKVPALALDFLRKYREMKYNEMLFEMLAKQYEMAKLDEAKEAGWVQVVDQAVPPEKHSKPKRILLILLITFGAVLLTSFTVVGQAAVQRATRVPDTSAKVRQLRHHLLHEPWGGAQVKREHRE